MTTAQAQRLEALHLFNKLSRTRRFMKYQSRLWRNNYPAMINVVAALNTDLVRSVEDRVRVAGGVANVVIYWPESGRMEIVRVGHEEDEYLMRVNPVDVHDDSTIEMLWSLIEQTGPVYATSRAEVLT
jgi:hypothetical protein